MAKAWMPLYIADYLADTGHLDHEEHGVYLLCIMHYWQTGKPLPKNAKQLLSICRCFASERFDQIWSNVSKFFRDEESGWYHDRIESELDKSRNISEKRRNAGKIGGENRVANAKQMLEQLPTQSQSQSQSQSEPKKESKSSRFTPPDWIDLDCWNSYLEMRVKIKKPLTGKAMEMAVEKLDQLRAQGEDVSAVLNQSTFSSWQGLFSVKKEMISTMPIIGKKNLASRIGATIHTQEESRCHEY